eukprot:9865930-Alexandrium_andersonii.AAC.1
MAMAHVVGVNAHVCQDSHEGCATTCTMFRACARAVRFSGAYPILPGTPTECAKGPAAAFPDMGNRVYLAVG